MLSRFKPLARRVNREIKERIVAIGPGTRVLRHPDKLVFPALPLALGWPWGGPALQSIWLYGGLGVALGWLWVPKRLPTACLPNGFDVALIWLWVACTLQHWKHSSGVVRRKSGHPRHTHLTRARIRPEASLSVV